MLGCDGALLGLGFRVYEYIPAWISESPAGMYKPVQKRVYEYSPTRVSCPGVTLQASCKRLLGFGFRV